MRRAAVVPSPVEHRHFEGKGTALLAVAEMLQMIADAVGILAGEPAAAAHALRGTALLWLSDEAPMPAQTRIEPRASAGEPGGRSCAIVRDADAAPWRDGAGAASLTLCEFVAHSWVLGQRC